MMILKKLKVNKKYLLLDPETGFFGAQEIFPDRSKPRSAASSKLAACGVSDN
jgi:hypothetical protein